MRTTFGPFAGAALCLALVAGCSGGEQRPSTLPPVSPSPVPSVVPSPTPSPTEEQAVEAAVRFYYDGFARAFEKRDAQELAAASTEDCSCRAIVKKIADVVARGTVRGGEVTVESVDVATVDGVDATANVMINGQPGTLVGADGRVLQELAGEGRVREAVVLRKTPQGWKVSGILELQG